MNQREQLRAMMDSAEYTPPETSLHFHISTMTHETARNISGILREAGIEAVVVPTTQERDGIILTDRLADFTWDSQSWRWKCDGSCRARGEAEHRDYRHLTEEQRSVFAERVMDAVNRERGNLRRMDLSDISDMGPPVCTTECLLPPSHPERG